MACILGQVYAAEGHLHSAHRVCALLITAAAALLWGSAELADQLELRLLST